MQACVKNQRRWLVVERLPGYAHDLNPVELIWGNLKSSELANLCPDTIEEAAHLADVGLNRSPALFRVRSTFFTARLIARLVNDADWITGQTVASEGGWSSVERSPCRDTRCCHEGSVRRRPVSMRVPCAR